MNRCWLLCVFVLTQHNALATPADYDRVCNSRLDPTTEMVCNLALTLDASPLKVGAGMVMANIQMTGTYCNFNFSRRFLDARLKFETDQENARIVRFLINQYRGKPPPGFNGDPKVFCKITYDTFGPRSRERFFD